MLKAIIVAVIVLCSSYSYAYMVEDSLGIMREENSSYLETDAMGIMRQHNAHD